MYNSYTNKIRSAMQKSKFSKSVNETHANFSGRLSGLSENVSDNLNLEEWDKPESSLRPLGDLLSIESGGTSKLGEHPDFIHLKGTSKTELHYITSVFIDIKGSTNLHKTYDLETIHTITNTIQRAAIHTCLIFGGHIQRLQGDGVFVYFGGKNIDKKKSIEMALNATSLINYFVKHDIKKLFEDEGVEGVYTRIGIDFGDDNKVMWATYGLGNYSELTTNSLHTSLAAKMQSHATANGTVVGDNVKSLINLSEEFFSYVTDSTGKITARYIFEDSKKGFYYTQYRFDWLKYLKGLSFIKSDDNGTMYVFDAEKAEKERQQELRKAAELIKTQSAFTDRNGFISSDPSGIRNQEHRFHYGA